MVGPDPVLIDGAARGRPEGDAVALVTGANRGLGAQFVEVLLERGARTVYAGSRNPAALAAARERHGERLVPVRLDVTDADDLDRAVLSCPDVDLVVCNAGQTCVGGVLEVPDEAAFRAAFEVNFFGPLRLARRFAPLLTERRGRLLFVNSLSAFLISRSSPIYSATKAACLMLAVGLREELKDSGVVVTSTFPGFIDTDMTTSMAIEKASPRSVAERSLDGLMAGATSVFPDRFAEMVRDALEHDMSSVLTEPQQVASRVVREFRATATADA